MLFASLCDLVGCGFELVGFLFVLICILGCLFLVRFVDGFGFRVVSGGLLFAGLWVVWLVIALVVVNFGVGIC